MVNIYNGIFKKEWNNAICGNMDGLRDYHAECSKADRKRQIWYDIISMSNLKKKKDRNELIYKTETDSQTSKQAYGYQKGKGQREGMHWEFGINIYTLLHIK